MCAILALCSCTHLRASRLCCAKCPELGFSYPGNQRATHSILQAKRVRCDGEWRKINLKVMEKKLSI